MKEYIVITLNNDTVIFDYRTITDEEKTFVNKHSFFKDSLFYTLKFYKNHRTAVYNTITVNVNQSYVTTMIINRLITFKYAFVLFEGLKLTTLKLNFLSTIDMEDYDMFLTSKTLKNVDCYFMPSTYLEKFNNAGIKVTEFCETKISQRFMAQQNVLTNDSLYYKKTININEDYPELISDLTEFLKINYKLKAIHLYVFSIELINKIIELVKEDESRNVVVFLHQGYDKGEFIVNNFAWLKEISEKCKNDYTCEFRIIYSSSFLKNNLFKQLTFNNLKLISILAIYVSVVCLMLIKSYEYIEEMSINNLSSDLINESYANPEENTPDEELEDEELDDQDEISNMSKEEAKKRYSFDKSFKSLKKINKETVAYLVVNNTEINYPVVQHSDNSYYLKRDFYKRSTSMGWIYLDYRNNVKELDDNNIIYGHSMLNGTMFGTLKKVLSSSWRKDEENMIITFDTEKKSYKFKIFSAYKVNYTTDYLKTTFDTNKDKKAFIKLITGRSSFRSGIKVTEKDKILTLSTCTGSNNKRLVVHAVLLKDEE